MHRPARIDQAILRWRADWASGRVRAGSDRLHLVRLADAGSASWPGCSTPGGESSSGRPDRRSRVAHFHPGAGGRRRGRRRAERCAPHGAGRPQRRRRRGGRASSWIPAGTPHDECRGLAAGDRRGLRASSREPRFGIVSDIDDTVMVTALPRPLLAAWHTFVVNEHARATTPGMPVLYERLTDAHPGAPVIYLSTGAWNVAPTLTRFLSQQPLPARRPAADRLGPDPDRWFRSGRSTSGRASPGWADEFPQIKWLLVGDDGQHDEVIYASSPTPTRQNVAVCIRQLTPGEAVLAGRLAAGVASAGGQPRCPGCTRTTAPAWRSSWSRSGCCRRSAAPRTPSEPLRSAVPTDGASTHPVGRQLRDDATGRVPTEISSSGATVVSRRPRPP